MGEISDVIKDAVIEQIRASLVTSARPDWTNEVIDFSGEGNFEGIEDAIRKIVKEEVANSGEKGTAGKEKAGKKEEGAGTDITKRVEVGEKQQKVMIDKIQKQDQAILKGFNAAKNPLGAGANQITSMLDKVPAAKMALRMVPFVLIALEAPKVFNAIVAKLIAPGGPFDKRLRIILEEQEQAFISRQAQKRRSIGLDQVVISQQGFGNMGGRLATNSLNKVKQTGTSGIGLNEVQIGMKD